jgi:hypothetical protein
MGQQRVQEIIRRSFNGSLTPQECKTLAKLITGTQKAHR